ncbi:hypothetical protein ES705_15516 [subsurface metagenome]
MKINKSLANNLHFLTKKSNDRKERKLESIKERNYLKIKLYNLRGQVVGEIGQGESIDYQKLLSKKKAVIR